MTPTILVAGATGNTGRSTVETLSKLLQSSKTFSGYRILALTRNASGAAAKALAKFPSVEIAEKSWVEITSEWLIEQHVVRAFIAAHNLPNAFCEESKFHLAALNAGVKYMVRISTTAANVKPDCKAYYCRTHWAIEALLSSPEFSNMQWSSLQPNVFTTQVLNPVAEFVKQFRKTGKQDKLSLMFSEDAPVGIVDAPEVGTFAAHLLSQEDTSAHNQARYVLNGPEDISGKGIVELVEKEIGTKVENVIYSDMSFVEQMAAADEQNKEVLLTIKYAVLTAWDGKCTASTTSKEVLEIAAPKRTPAEVWKELLST